MEYIIEMFCASLFFGYIFYKWANKNFDFFSKGNIAHEKPFFLVGNNFAVLEGRETTQELLIRLHNQFKDEQIFGYYDFRTPYFFINDPKLIEKIAVHDIEYFLDRIENPAILSDETTSRMLIATEEKEWLEKQSMFQHLFSEDKITQIFEILNECNKAAIKYLNEKVGPDGKEIDLEDYFHRYCNDVIASAAFGIQINSFKNKNNEFFNMATDLLRTRSLYAAIKAFYLTISPHVYKVYRLNRIYIKTLQFVRNIFSRIFWSGKNIPGNPNESQNGMELKKLVTGFLTKFSSSVKSVVLIIFPQISILVNLVYFIQTIRSYVKNFFNPKPKQRQEERITPKVDEAKPREKTNKFLGVAKMILKNFTGAIKSLIFTIFPQILLISRLYVLTKTAISYLRGKTVGQEDLQKKKKLSKIESALLKLERFVVVMKLLILTNFPAVKKIIKLNVLNAKALNYMKCLASQTLQQRQGDAIVRLDMIHFMLEAKQKIDPITENEVNESTPVHSATKITEDEIAQCIMFLFAGLQQMSKMLCITVFELMKNPDIQEKLFAEVLRANEELKNDEISYEVLKNMKYMDMVVSEALRKWPSEPLLYRVCSKSYILKDVEGRNVQEFKPGDKICFSVYGSHFDEQYFENPFTFDPQRFSDEFKIKPYTYFPFGVGARKCKGKQLGLIVIKIMLFRLILKFNFCCGMKSTPDLFSATRRIQLKQSEFFWMNIVPRNRNPEQNLPLLKDQIEENLI